MKILIISKKSLIRLILFFLICLIIFSLFIFISNRFSSKETLYPLNSSQNNTYDLNGDGIKDNISLIEGQNKLDVQIKCQDNQFLLSKELPDKILFDADKYFTPKIFIHDISRNSIPEIIISGYKNSKNINYIYTWNKDKFNLIYTSNNNILGILDCKNTHTPQCYSFNASDGLNSLKSFMLVNNSLVDTTADSKSIPSLEPVTNFINIMELPYTLDELPDIFSPNISKNELSLLWNLDKDNNSYSFQDGFFYDYEWNNSSIPTSIKWRLSFTKNNFKEKDSNKSELSLLVNLSKDNSSQSSYKITSIQISK